MHRIGNVDVILQMNDISVIRSEINFYVSYCKLKFKEDTLNFQKNIDHLGSLTWK